MILPKVVTFTGADDSVDANDLTKLSTDYPNVEWGILFGGRTVEGSPRWPSAKWLDKELPKLAGLNLTAHLCGRWVYDLILRGDFTWLYAYNHTELFQRVQLNFHGSPFPDAAPSFLARIGAEPQQFIFQNDGVNGHLMGNIGTDKRVRLFDVSSGAGTLPGETGDTWPKRTMKEYMGYAGGLGPTNIKTQLKLIEKAANPEKWGPYWCDMESHVRTKTREHGDVFDLAKCRKVCEEVWG